MEKVITRRVTVGQLLDFRDSIKVSFESPAARTRRYVIACVDAITGSADYSKVADILSSAVAYHYASLCVEDSQEFIYDFARELKRALEKHGSKVLFEVDSVWRRKYTFMTGISFIAYHYSDSGSPVVDCRFRVRNN